MPKLHDAQGSFSSGRTGDGLRVRQETRAYAAGVFDSDNWMVTAKAQARRRWGTLVWKSLTGPARIEPWVYAGTDELRFILAFQDASLTVFDLDGAERASFTGQAWTAESMWFLTYGVQLGSLVIADASMPTMVLELDPADHTFSLRPFAFTKSDDGLTLNAPFLPFGKSTLLASTEIFTAEGTGAEYQAAIEAAGTSAGIFGDGVGENPPPATFDLAAGTGKLRTNEDFFLAGHVGDHMRLADGEFEVLAVNDPREAEIKVLRNISQRLDANPFYVRKSSKVVEVAIPDHNLKPGDKVFFLGISSEDTLKNVLTHAQIFTTGTTAPTPSGGAEAYTVQRVVNPNHIEIMGDAASTTEELLGGSDVEVFRFQGIAGLREPVFSAARGWPQAAGFHESRLFLGGSDLLKNAAFGSRFDNLEDFDLGEGNPDDAIRMTGIGDQSHVRHFISSFDLIMLTDNGTFYAPGSTDRAMTQESARAIKATENGCSYTTPNYFDAATVYMGAQGNNIREMDLRGNDSGYHTPPVSSVVSDWVKQQKHCASFDGAPVEATPYLIWSNGSDGKAIVYHSQRADQSIGFMRWRLENGKFWSFAGVGGRLFCVGEREGRFAILEFDTPDGVTVPTTVDFGETLTADPAKAAWTSTAHSDVVVQCHSGLTVYSDAAIGVDGTFTTPEAVASVSIGYPMPHSIVSNAGITGSGQGPKIGKMQRLVSAEINWIQTVTGQVNGVSALGELDNVTLEAPIPVDEWREYTIGEWGREPKLEISGNTPGFIGIRGFVLNVYF